MFALRGVAVSFSTFVLLYCGWSLIVSSTWHSLFRHNRQMPRRWTAELLFAWRVSPFLIAAVITLVLAVPSFLMLEPRQIEESLGAVPLVLCICGAGLIGCGISRAVSALRLASRAISEWMTGAQPIPTDAPAALFRVSGVAPAMIATGIVHAGVLVSERTETLLSAGELQIALDHEFAHVRHRDNLKKLLLKLLHFPGMRSLETAWLEATEMAADDTAVSSREEALDLAAAIIKLSRMRSPEPVVELTASLTPSSVSAMQARIERLLAWSAEADGDRYTARKALKSPAVVGIFATAVFVIANYSSLLASVHSATEWLVR